MNERVQVEVKDGIADVRLCRPDKRNALDRSMFQGLVQAGKDLSADPSVRVAVLHGAAYGAGLQVALGADMRIVAPDAKLAFVEVNWGLVPDMSGTQALRRLVPLDVAKRMSMTGLPITGEQAVRYGLATEVSDTPYETACEIAEIIAKKSPEAIRSLKRLLNQSALVPLAEGLAMEFELSGALMGTPNQMEAIGASFEKREPVFQDPEA